VVPGLRSVMRLNCPSPLTLDVTFAPTGLRRTKQLQTPRKEGISLEEPTIHSNGFVGGNLLSLTLPETLCMCTKEEKLGKRMDEQTKAKLFSIKRKGSWRNIKYEEKNKNKKCIKEKKNINQDQKQNVKLIVVIDSKILSLNIGKLLMKCIFIAFNSMLRDYKMIVRATKFLLLKNNSSC
jgi:hypothetical protein